MESILMNAQSDKIDATDKYFDAISKYKSFIRI